MAATQQKPPHGIQTDQGEQQAPQGMKKDRTLMVVVPDGLEPSHA